MAPTTVTSIVLVVLGVLLLMMASYAWFGSWEPHPRRTRDPEDWISAEVEALRHAIETYERERRGS